MLDVDTSSRPARSASVPAAGVAVADAQGVLLGGDEAFASLLGTTPERLATLPLGDLLAGDDLAAFRSAATALLQHSVTAAVVDVAVAPLEPAPHGADPERRPVRLTCTRGAAPYVLLVAEDLTPRHDVAEEARLLRGLLRDTDSGATPELALSVALRRICTSAGWDAAQLWTTSAEGTLRCSRSWFTTGPELDAIRAASVAGPLRPGSGRPGSAWLTARPVRVPLTPGDGVDDPRSAAFASCPVADLLEVPLVVHGVPVAVLELMSRTPRGARSVRLATAAAAQLAPGVALYATEQSLARAKDRVARLEAAISRDPLTGLIGRALLHDRILMAQVRAERHDSGMAVFAIDIDGLADVNDQHGRTGGDRVLVEAADRLLQAMRSTDTCARVGGDSFVVVCEDIDARLAAYPVSDRLVSALSQPYLLDNGSAVRISASVGTAMCEGPYEDVESLLGRAQTALAAARTAGGGRAVVDSTLHGADDEDLGDVPTAAQWTVDYAPAGRVSDAMVG